MIQRPQSICLVIIIMALTAATYLPLWQAEGLLLSTWQLTDTTSGLPQSFPFPYLFIGLGTWVAALVAFYELFQYHNRTLQLQLGFLNTLLLSTLLLAALYLVHHLRPHQPGHYQTSFFLLLLALTSNLVANFFIRKDEALVRSADRMR